MRFAAIENGHFVSAIERITNLKRARESGAAENEEVQRLTRFFGKQASGADRSSSSSSEFDEVTTRCEGIHIRAQLLLFRTSAPVVISFQLQALC